MYLAAAFMQANLGRQLLLRHICRAARTSERALEYAFHAVHGIGPKQYLTRLRLEQVRQTLLAVQPGEITVRGAAQQAGFRHMGHFSAAYRSLYGERPSDTLRQ